MVCEKAAPPNEEVIRPIVAARVFYGIFYISNAFSGLFMGSGRVAALPASCRSMVRPLPAGWLIGILLTS